MVIGVERARLLRGCRFSILFDLVDIFEVARLATRELHFWVHLHLIHLVALAVRIRTFDLLLVGEEVGELLSKHGQAVEVSIR